VFGGGAQKRTLVKKDPYPTQRFISCEKRGKRGDASLKTEENWQGRITVHQKRGSERINTSGKERVIISSSMKRQFGKGPG